MAGKTKLELTWIGKNKREELEPRVLVEDKALNHFALAPDGSTGLRNNYLIKGDNLLALKAIEAEYAGKIKCAYIDPPYNVQAATDFYDDGLEHSQWLSLMKPRISLIWRLLSEDGSLWINIDEHEGHYLKVLCDEVFGRNNFVTQITWQKKYSVSNNAKSMASICDLILVYRKSEQFSINLLPRDDTATSRYTNPDHDPRGPWKAVDYLNQASVSARPNLVYDIVNPNTGETIKNREKAWKYEKSSHEKHVLEDRIWWGKNGKNSVPALKLFLSEVRQGVTPHNWWPHTEVGHTDGSKKESAALFGKAKAFDTPKPERLIERVLTIATNPGDVVLDSFAGSGTTGAVAHKMSRRWIMVELGDHADTHIVPRIKKVICGQDPGGVTQSTGWQGGGGYHYFRLAPSLLEKDQWGQYVISKKYNPEMLAEAVCKLMGFTYAPSQDHFWLHGHSTENDFIYVTTQRLPHDTLRKLSHEVGVGRTLLVCCRAHDENAFDNLTVRKIPHAVMAKCEWGRDDYSLNIQEASAEPITEGNLNEDDTVEAAE